MTAVKRRSFLTSAMSVGANLISPFSRSLRSRRNRRIALAASIATALLAPALFSSTTHSAQPPPSTCQVRLSGAAYPTMVPAQQVWEAAFARYLSAPTVLSTAALTPTVKTALGSRGAGALDKVAALRRTLPPGAGDPRKAAIDRDLVIADTILDARDIATRDASDFDIDIMLDLAESTAKSLFTDLPVSGQIVTGQDGTRTCETSVLGKDYPFLVPEYQVWAVQFASWARAAAHNRGTDGRVTDDYIILVQRTNFPALAADLRLFFDIAAEAASEIDVIRARPSGDATEQATSQELQVQRAVLKARTRVLRAVSVEGWRAISNRVESAKVGAKVWFRSQVDG